MTSPIDYSDYDLFYDGAVKPSTSGHTFKSINPATAQVLADIHTASHEEIDAAVSSARKALSIWASMPATQRSRILHRAAAILRFQNDEIAELETCDTGKPFSETSTVDVLTGADVLEYYANLVGGGGLNGETVQLRDGVWCYTSKEPLGVCVGIGAVRTVRNQASFFKQNMHDRICSNIKQSHDMSLDARSCLYQERSANCSSEIVKWNYPIQMYAIIICCHDSPCNLK